MGRQSVIGLALIICAALPAVMVAQTSSASINGTVKDPTAAVIPAATVTLRNVATGVQQIVETNSAGDYVLLNILPGRYTLQASKQGFATVTEKEFSLYVNQTATFDFTLAVGSASQSVTVQAEATHVEASTAELGSVVDTRQVSDLPLNGRNFTQLLLLTPGASPVNISQNAGGWGSAPIGVFSFPALNGQRNRSNYFMLDGTNNLSTYVSEYAFPPIIDDVQEFKVDSHNDSAEFGGAVGGIVNAVTKSGTNAFHGDVWEFVRNSAVDSRNFFNPSTTPLRQNQFGATTGGPVLFPHYNGRNKTFFFVAYEGFRQSLPLETLFRVFTPDELSGNLSDLGTTIYNPYSTRPDPANPGLYLRDPFQNSTIPANLLSPTAALWAQTFYPAPIDTGFPGTNGRYTQPQLTSQDQGTVRFDETFSSQDTAFVRWSGISQKIVYGGGGALDLSGDTYLHGDQIGASWIHSFSGNSILQVAFGHNYDMENDLTLNTGLPQSVVTALGYSPNWTNYSSGRILLPGEFPGSGFLGAEPSVEHNVWTDVYEGKMDFTKIVGRHTIKMGAAINTIPVSRIENFAESSYAPTETSNLETGAGGLSVASFLLGVPDSAYRSNTVYDITGGYVDRFYVGDQWKATNRLTVNIGLGFDLPLYPAYPSVDGGTLDYDNGTYLMVHSFPACSATQAAPCIPGGTLPAHVVVSPNGKTVQNHYDNWEPHLGLAYRLASSTALRGSYARIYDNWGLFTQVLENMTTGWPEAETEGNASPLNQLTPTTFTPNPLGLTSVAYPPATPYTESGQDPSPDWRDAHSDQWNLGVQHQLNVNTVITANYVGAADSNLSVGNVYNTALTPGPGPIAPRQLWPYLPSSAYDRSVGHSTYHALQLSFERKTSRGLTYLLSYTWSKNIDLCSGEFEQGCAPQDPYNLGAEKSVSASDLPQMLSFSYNYNVPFGKGRKWQSQNKFIDYLIGNWQLNGILSLDSGVAYYVLAGSDVANTGTYGERVNLTGQPLYESPRTVAQWLNPNGFALPAAFTYGNEGRNILRTDWTRNLDFSLFREFPLPFSETSKLQFRVEAFNSLNTPVFGIPDSTFTDPTFGQAFSTLNTERQVQFALKLFF